MRLIWLFTFLFFVVILLNLFAVLVHCVDILYETIDARRSEGVLRLFCTFYLKVKSVKIKLSYNKQALEIRVRKSINHVYQGCMMVIFKDTIGGQNRRN